MFGSKGPRSKRGGGPSPRSQDASRSGGGALETVIITPSARRRPDGPSSPPSRVTGARRAARSRLVDLAADWFSTILALEQVAELPDASALRARALDLKSTFERSAAE